MKSISCARVLQIEREVLSVEGENEVVEDAAATEHSLSRRYGDFHIRDGAACYF